MGEITVTQELKRLWLVSCFYHNMRMRSIAQLCPTLCDPSDYSLPGFSIHGIFQAKNTGVGWHFLLQGIFLTQRTNLRLLHWQEDSLPLSHQGSPAITTAAHKSRINDHTLLSLDADLVCWLYNLKCLIDYFIALGFVYIIFFPLIRLKFLGEGNYVFYQLPANAVAMRQVEAVETLRYQDGQKCCLLFFPPWVVSPSHGKASWDDGESYTISDSLMPKILCSKWVLIDSCKAINRKMKSVGEAV